MSALSHIRVLDLGRGYPASIAATYLGDFGADVIRVDQPVRRKQSERGLAFTYPLRNKRSITLDLKTAAHREVLYKLAKTADVFIENNRPGVMKRLKCDYDTLKELNPRLIYCACSGYGQDGPYAMMPGHDMNYISVNGALSLVGPKGGPPCFPSNMLGDMAGCALHATIGILIALTHRERTGQGQFVDISYMDGAMATMVSELTTYLYSGVVPRRGDSRLTGGALWAQVYQCRDGEYFTVACADQELWENFCDALGRKDIKGKRESTGAEKDRIAAELAGVFLTRTRYEWFDFFKDKDVCATPVNNIDEAVSDPQVLHRRMILEFDHPVAGKVRQLGIPIKLSATPGSVRFLGLPAGANSKEILTELGYTEKEITELLGNGR